MPYNSPKIKIKHPKATETPDGKEKSDNRSKATPLPKTIETIIENDEEEETGLSKNHDLVETRQISMNFSSKPKYEVCRRLSDDSGNNNSEKQSVFTKGTKKIEGSFEDGIYGGKLQQIELDSIKFESQIDISLKDFKRAIEQIALNNAWTFNSSVVLLPNSGKHEFCKILKNRILERRQAVWFSLETQNSFNYIIEIQRCDKYSLYTVIFKKSESLSPLNLENFIKDALHKTVCASGHWKDKDIKSLKEMYGFNNFKAFRKPSKVDDDSKIKKRIESWKERIQSFIKVPLSQ